MQLIVSTHNNGSHCSLPQLSEFCILSVDVLAVDGSSDNILVGLNVL